MHAKLRRSAPKEQTLTDWTRSRPRREGKPSLLEGEGGEGKKRHSLFAEFLPSLP